MVGCTPDDGRAAKHVLRRIGQRVDARQHDLAHRRWHRGAVLAFDREELLGEEDVAIGAAVRTVDQVRRRLTPDDCRDELAYLVAIEAREIDPLDRARAVELCEQAAQRMTPVEVVGSIRTHEHHRCRTETASEIPEQFSRRAVGPMEIFEYEQGRYALGQPFEQSEQLFEQCTGDDALTRRRMSLG